jgi:hypothetical protein
MTDLPIEDGAHLHAVASVLKEIDVLVDSEHVGSA